MLTINIFTDASLDPTTQNAGYAFYLGCRGHKLMRAGILKAKTKNITRAELQAIINAVHTLSRSNFPKPTKIVIHTDNMENVKVLTGAQQTPYDPDTRRQFEELLFLCLTYLQSHGYPVNKYRSIFEFKHVPAHTKGTDKHSLINAWCDTEAKRYRLEADHSEGKNLKKKVK